MEAALKLSGWICCSFSCHDVLNKVCPTIDGFIEFFKRNSENNQRIDIPGEKKNRHIYEFFSGCFPKY